MLKQVKEAVPDTPVFANTGVRAGERGGSSWPSPTAPSSAPRSSATATSGTRSTRRACASSWHRCAQIRGAEPIGPDTRRMDKRWQQLGDLLVNYSTAVQPGRARDDRHGRGGTLPLAEAVYEAAVSAGGLPAGAVPVGEPCATRCCKYGNAEQLAWVPEIEAYGMEWADVYFGAARRPTTCTMHADIPADRLARSTRPPWARSRPCAGRRRAGAWCACPTPPSPSRPRRTRRRSRNVLRRLPARLGSRKRASGARWAAGAQPARARCASSARRPT